MLIFVHPASSGLRDSRAAGLSLVVEITLFCDFPAIVLVQKKMNTNRWTIFMAWIANLCREQEFQKHLIVPCGQILFPPCGVERLD
jgi:hypothetical protein